MGDIATFAEAYPNITFRHYIQPSIPLASGLQMLDFTNNTNTWPMQAIGRDDGANAVAQGEGFMFAKMKEWHNSPELQAEYKLIGDYITHVSHEQHLKFKAERRHGVFMKNFEKKEDQEFIQ